MLQEFIAREHLEDMKELGKVPIKTEMTSHIQENTEVIRFKINVPFVDGSEDSDSSEEKNMKVESIEPIVIDVESDD
jgi:hypothetical protein